MSQFKELLKHLPAVNRLLQDDRVKQYFSVLSFETVSKTVSSSVDELRQQMLQSLIHPHELNAETIYPYTLSKVLHTLEHISSQKLIPVINATGVVLHTNLGRARLSEQAAKSVSDIATSYSNLEYRLLTGERGSRHDHLEQLVRLLTGAEAAMVVNNNAAAVFLILNELASGKEAIVSRGQLVEIGGSFRVSEIMKQSGVSLVEVGTTNKTHLYDYEKAISEQTSLLMKVHTSNFRMMGFTDSVSTEQLVSLGQKYHLPVYEDVGSGVLLDLQSLGITDEPVISEVIATGVDLVSFSGDKLLGGPQAGIIAGKKKWIDRLKKNQLARVLRVDKFTIAALEATLLHYAAGEEMAKLHVPVLRAMYRKVDTLSVQAERFVHLLCELDREKCIDSEIISGQSAVGGGSLPGFELPSVLVTIDIKGLSASQTEALFRMQNPPIIGRIQHGRYQLDMRTVEENEVDLLAETIVRAVRKNNPSV